MSAYYIPAWEESRVYVPSMLIMSGAKFVIVATPVAPLSVAHEMQLRLHQDPPAARAGAALPALSSNLLASLFPIEVALTALGSAGRRRPGANEVSWRIALSSS